MLVHLASVCRRRPRLLTPWRSWPLGLEICCKPQIPVGRGLLPTEQAARDPWERTVPSAGLCGCSAPTSRSWPPQGTGEPAGALISCHRVAQADHVISNLLQLWMLS